MNLIELTPWLSTNRCRDQCYFFDVGPFVASLFILNISKVAFRF